MIWQITKFLFYAILMCIAMSIFGPLIVLVFVGFHQVTKNQERLEDNMYDFMHPEIPDYDDEE